MLLRAFLIALVFGTSACSAGAQSVTVDNGSYRMMLKTLLSHTVPEIDATSAAAQRDEAVFLDAREPAEYAVSHIAEARLVGYDHFEMSSVESLPKDQPIIVYCSVGYRSEKISEELLAAGFTDVQNLYGGIFEWKNRDLPVVDTTVQATERVHAFNRTWGIWLRKGEKVY